MVFISSNTTNYTSFKPWLTFITRTCSLLDNLYCVFTKHSNIYQFVVRFVKVASECFLHPLFQFFHPLNHFLLGLIHSLSDIFLNIISASIKVFPPFIEEGSRFRADTISAGHRIRISYLHWSTSSIWFFVLFSLDHRSVWGQTFSGYYDLGPIFSRLFLVLTSRRSRWTIEAKAVRFVGFIWNWDLGSRLWVLILNFTLSYLPIHWQMIHKRRRPQTTIKHTV